jgi:hypothetical protein
MNRASCAQRTLEPVHGGEFGAMHAPRRHCDGRAVACAFVFPGLVPCEVQGQAEASAWQPQRAADDTCAHNTRTPLLSTVYSDAGTPHLSEHFDLGTRGSARRDNERPPVVHDDARRDAMRERPKQRMQRHSTPPMAAYSSTARCVASAAP